MTDKLPPAEFRILWGFGTILTVLYDLRECCGFMPSVWYGTARHRERAKPRRVTDSQPSPQGSERRTTRVLTQAASKDPAINNITRPNVFPEEMRRLFVVLVPTSNAVRSEAAELTAIADGFLEEVLQQAPIEGAVGRQQHILQEVVALLKLVPEEEITRRLIIRPKLSLQRRGRGSGGVFDSGRDRTAGARARAVDSLVPQRLDVVSRVCDALSREGKFRPTRLLENTTSNVERSVKESVRSK